MPLSNLPPGVTETMIPGFHDESTEIEEYDPLCPECGCSYSDHTQIEILRDGYLFEDYECPEVIGRP